MKNIKFIVLGVSLVCVSLLAYGTHLSLSRPWYEDTPKQIEGVDSEKYNFEWYNPSTNDTVLSTAWDFTPEQSDIIIPLINKRDTAWFFERSDTLYEVYWAQDITIEAERYQDEILRYTVYWSDSL